MLQDPRSSIINPLASRLRLFDLHSTVITKLLVPLTLTCLWALMIFVVDPRGNFPLNDDWSYALAVKALVEQGHLHMIDWIAATAVAQILWGALFCLPFGFSFMALRVSSLAFGLIGVLATYGLLRESKAHSLVAFFGAALIATNPLYFELSNTFMTDIPFYATTVLTLLMFIRGLRRKAQPEILAGALFGCIAILIRQMGIVIPISFAIAYLLLRGIHPKNWFSAIYPTLLGILSLLIYQITQGFSGNYGQVDLPAALRMSFGTLLKAFVVNSFMALTYLGLFLLPFLLLWLTPLWRKLSFHGRLLPSLMFIGLFVFLLWQGRSMPFLPEHGNILMKSGLGPAPLRDSFLELHHLPNLPASLWWILTAAGVLGTSLLLATLFLVLPHINPLRRKAGFASAEPSFPTKSFHPSLVVLLSLTCILYFGPISLTGFYDRYLLPLLPMLMSLVVLTTNSAKLPTHHWEVLASASLFIVYAFFTLGATHDYFSWNRARWDALYYLTGPQMQISAREIDGGYEFNGWYNYDPQYQASPDKSDWWVENDDYVVVFGPIPGYQVIKRFTYEKWIPFGQGSVYILHRTDSAPSN